MDVKTIWICVRIYCMHHVTASLGSIILHAYTCTFWAPLCGRVHTSRSGHSGNWAFHSICTEVWFQREIRNNYFASRHAPFWISCSCQNLFQTQLSSPCLPKQTLCEGQFIENSSSDEDASLNIPFSLGPFVIGQALSDFHSFHQLKHPDPHSTLGHWWSSPHSWSISWAVAIWCDCQHQAAAALHLPAGGSGKVLVVYIDKRYSLFLHLQIDMLFH